MFDLWTPCDLSVPVGTDELLHVQNQTKGDLHCLFYNCDLYKWPTHQKALCAHFRHQFTNFKLSISVRSYKEKMQVQLFYNIAFQITPKISIQLFPL